MDQNALINEAANLIDTATENQIKGFYAEAQAGLVQLRVLLNAQPELEAGGASTTPPTPEQAPET